MARVPELKMPPPPFAELPERVELVMERMAPLSLKMPPPTEPAVLPERVELVSVVLPLML